MLRTPENAELICEGLANGKSLRAICRDNELHESSVRKWMSEDEEFGAQSARARELGHESLAEQCIDIADNSELKADERRIMIDTRLRLLGKWSQRYADKEIKQHQGADGGPIAIRVTFDD